MSAGEWKELKPRLGDRLDGLVEAAPILDEGSTLLHDGDALRIVGRGVPWSYLARFRMHSESIPPASSAFPLIVRITAAAVRARVGAICVGDDWQTVLSNSVEWTPEDGQIALDLVVYTFPGRGWLVFRNTAVAVPDVLVRIISVEVFPLCTKELADLESRASAATSRAVIYTAITNNYDTLKPPQRTDPLCDYVCCTDEPGAVPPPWKAMPIVRKFRDPRLDALWHRLHPHLLFPGHDLSIYVDGRMELRESILPLARSVLRDTHLACFDNPWWSCMYLAADDDVRVGRDTESVVRKQVERYRLDGFPRQLACLPPGVLLRRHHDPELIAMAAAWWQEILHGTHRDELSFAYILWKLRIPFRRIWLPVHDNPYMKLGEHNFIEWYRA